MRGLLFVALFALALALAAAQTRPKLSETFEMISVAHVVNNGTNYFGEGRWAVDQPTGRAVEDISFGGFLHLNFYDLSRFDLKKNYWIVSTDRKVCHSKELTGKMPLVWEWLEKADFSHNVTEAGEVYTVWRYSVAGVRLEAGVPAKNPNTLSFFSRQSAYERVTLYVQRWATERPHPSWFDVPKECAGTAIATNAN